MAWTRNIGREGLASGENQDLVLVSFPDRQIDLAESEGCALEPARANGISAVALFPTESKIGHTLGEKTELNKRHWASAHLEASFSYARTLSVRLTRQRTNS